MKVTQTNFLNHEATRNNTKNFRVISCNFVVSISRGFLLLAVFALMFFNQACFSYVGFCRADVKKEIVSPDNILKAVIFESHCDRQTETRVSIIGAKEQLSNNDPGSVFVSNNRYREFDTPDGKRANIEVDWRNARQLLLAFNEEENLKVSRMKQSFEYVTIVYDKLPAVKINSNDNSN